MKIIVDSKETINKLVSSMVSELVANKPDACLAFAAGETLKGVFAELSAEEKDAVSHRGKALTELKAKLENYFKNN